MDELGIIVISGNLNEIGKILDVNLKFCQNFEFEKEDLVKNNVNKIVPFGIGQHHDRFIKNFLETANARILNKSKILFGQTANGFLIPLQNIIKTIPNLEESIRFIALMQKVRKTNFIYNAHSDVYKKSMTSFILCDANWYAFGITKMVIIIITTK